MTALRHTLFLVFAAAFLLAGAGRVAAEPALWRVEGGGGTLYVFGTIHRLPEGADWVCPKLSEIIERADSVILEVASSQAARDYMAIVASQPGVARGKEPLSEMLDDKTFARLTRKAAALGIAPSALDDFRPWYAAFLLSQVAGEQAGYFTRFGADTGVERIAGQYEVSRIGLETPAGQVLILASLPREAQIAFLEATLDSLGADTEGLAATAAAWLEGDIGALERLSLGPLQGHPALYETLIVERNRAWLPVIERQIEAGGAHLLAVGAGHLLGPDSVLALLEEKGYRVVRE